MTETRRCGQCGAALPLESPEGVCPRCVLRLGWPGGATPVGASAIAPGGGRPTSTFRPGSDFVAPEPAELAGRFAPLEILELLGQGGMGAVYKARQPKLNRLVALKILPGEAAADPAFAERFTREAQTLAQLSHPGIVGIYDFGEADGLYYFLMEYVDGVNLRQMLQTGKLRPHEALAIVPQICEALQYAHDQGIVHRDIKPENILVDKRGRVKIADFGLAKLLAEVSRPNVLTRSQQIMGTPHYMSPEQFERPQAVDHRSDIYSLGVVFYELLTGELPLGRFALPSQKAQLDVRLDQIVLRSLEKEPERRYQRAGDVKTEVENITRTPPLEEGRSAPRESLHPVDAINLVVTLLGFGLIGLGIWVTGSAWPLWALPVLVLICSATDGTKQPVLAQFGCSIALLATLGLIIYAIYVTNRGEPVVGLLALLAALIPLFARDQQAKDAKKAAEEKDPKEAIRQEGD
jgi:tRNA A-37 threonylcarbamoyl transferase component Bud32